MKNSRSSLIVLGKPLFSFDSVPSTNDIAKKLAKYDFAEGTSVVANEQTGGRGRFGRKWITPDGENIFLSLLLKPPIKPKDALILSIIGALAVARTIGSFCKKKIQIKWPNDVLISGKKICGILSELKIKDSFVDHVIMGIGINLNSDLSNLPEKLRKKSTSFSIETGKCVDKQRFLERFFSNLSKVYSETLSSSRAHLIRDCEKMLYKRNSTVMFRSESRPKKAIIKGLYADGALKLEIRGKNRKVYVGEILSELP